MSEKCNVQLDGLEPGAILCVYHYSSADRLLDGMKRLFLFFLPYIVIFAKATNIISRPNINAADGSPLSDFTVADGHPFYAVSWKGSKNTINIMCNKTEIESLKHRLSTLVCFLIFVNVCTNLFLLNLSSLMQGVLRESFRSQKDKKSATDMDCVEVQETVTEVMTTNSLQAKCGDSQGGEEVGEAKTSHA